VGHNTTTTPGKQHDITVYTVRDIEAGEQIFISYNGRDCADDDTTDDIEDYKDGTVYVLGDYGFVEDYPQKWIWEEASSLKEYIPSLVLELDRVVAPDPYDPAQQEMEQYQVTWVNDEPLDLQIINFLSGHLKMLEQLKGFVHESTEALTSDHERWTILKFYESLLVALQYSIWSYHDEAIRDDSVLLQQFAATAEEQEKEGGGAISNRLQDNSTARGHFNDSLERRPILGNPDGSVLYVCHHEAKGVAIKYEQVFAIETQYQLIEFYYSKKKDDICFFLSGWDQTCSVRPGAVFRKDANVRPFHSFKFRLI
jgi:hypothetical protein